MTLVPPLDDIRDPSGPLTTGMPISVRDVGPELDTARSGATSCYGSDRTYTRSAVRPLGAWVSRHLLWRNQSREQVSFCPGGVFAGGRRAIRSTPLQARLALPHPPPSATLPQPPRHLACRCIAASASNSAVAPILKPATTWSGHGWVSSALLSPKRQRWPHCRSVCVLFRRLGRVYPRRHPCCSCRHRHYLSPLPPSVTATATAETTTAAADAHTPSRLASRSPRTRVLPSTPLRSAPRALGCFASARLWRWRHARYSPMVRAPLRAFSARTWPRRRQRPFTTG